MIIEWFSSLNYVLQALFAGLFTWMVTFMGALCAICVRHDKENINNLMLGFASGVMIAASFWSLLSPAIVIAENLEKSIVLNVGFGFLIGGFAVAIVNKYIPHIHVIERDPDDKEIIKKTGLRRGILLFIAMTIHNIPEGLAIGVAFGAVASGIEGATLGAAIALAIGIGLQNFPEGFAVTTPLIANNVSKKKGLFYGQLSAIVEPFAAVIGAILVFYVQNILSFMLAFAAGAMIFVVVEELVPAANSVNGDDENKNKINNIASFAAIGCMLGFFVMMTLDVLLG